MQKSDRSMNILLLGSGGREHALAWRLKQSRLCDRLWIAPGNMGTAMHGENVSLSPLDFDAIADFVKENSVGMVVVGPEGPLVAGIVDYFAADPRLSFCKVIGPSKAGSMLEGSKDFAKQFMERHGIPTASFQTFNRNQLYQAFQYIDTLTPPYVLKADGLAAGKGVLILNNPDDAKRELSVMVNESVFGDAGKKVVIEEFMPGVECSVFIFTDGDEFILLPVAKDYKRIGDGNKGLNTGGMGAICPVNLPEILTERIKKQIIEPVLNGFREEGILYRGFLYIGLMVHENVPKVVEFNVRLGDPEAQALLPMLDTDLVELFGTLGGKNLGEAPIKIKSGVSVCVVAASEGYPEHFTAGKTISGLENMQAPDVFLAGVRLADQKPVTSGGRVLAVTARAETLEKAREAAYERLKYIRFEGKYHRSDIALDLIENPEYFGHE